MKKFTFVAIAALVSGSQIAEASSDSAWKALFAKVNGTCIGQSGMISPEASAPIIFDDSTGKIAILLREKKGNSKKMVNVLCLYDKKSGKASIAEYQWLGQ
ncbi:MAG: hypothetical protein KGI75_09970 [Rhizobiaceae bacterium]|nr:hypothetical protein [Rhizobiaceae bacterium]